MENRLVAITPKSPVEDVSERLELGDDDMGWRIRETVQRYAWPNPNGWPG